MESKEKISFYLYLIWKNRTFMLGIAIFALLIFSALFAPWITPFPDDALGDINIMARVKHPDSEHFFGTDFLGRDIFSRVVFGTRKSLFIGFGIVMMALLIGVPLGLIAGFFGGKLDELLMRISDGFLVFPPLLLPIAIGAALGSSLKINMIAIAIVWWPWYVRLIRSQVLTVREQLYIDASRAIGVKDRTIILRHVIMNSINPVIVQVSLDIGYAILLSAGLSFLGIGASPPTAEWGLMIDESRATFLDYWWTTTFPGLAIFIAVLGFNLLGDGLREILDPRIRRLG